MPVYSKRWGRKREDRDSIVGSGDVDQQRDAVLANFARYNNSLESMQKQAQ
jgi:hypothetical protein